MSKHTPGQWKVDNRSGMAKAMYGSCVYSEHFNTPGVVDGRGSVCECRGEFAEANARLIAAAPAFAEATAKWLQFYDSCVRDKAIGDEPGIAELRAALASIDAP